MLVACGDRDRSDPHAASPIGPEPESAAGADAASPDAASPDPPPIVLISIDTLRSDRLPAYGYRGVETPAIDALRHDGILFARAYSHSPLTLPAHVSLLTGVLPDVHGVRDNRGYPVDSALPFLPRRLAERGYATAAAVSAYVLHRSSGLDAAGFTVYEDAITPRGGGPGGNVLGGIARPAEETLDAIAPWLRENAGGPFFLFFHLFEPHLPYAPPEPFASRYDDPYDGEIAAADRVVGRLLDLLRELGVYDAAAIVLLSDHGEGLGDHGEAEHGILLYREAIQVPLVLKLPGNRRAGETVAAPAQLVDVSPTLLALAGARSPESPGTALETPGTAPETPGTSLLALEDAGERPIYAETFYPRLHFGWSELASLIAGRDHYIDGPAPELYDLVADPGETRNLVDERRARAAELRRALGRYRRALAPPAAVDAETRERLAALGYLSAPAAAAPDDGPLPDPKTRLPTLEPLRRAARHLERGELDAAVPLYRRALADNPRMVDGWLALGATLARLDLCADALAALRRAAVLAGDLSADEMPEAEDGTRAGQTRAGQTRAGETRAGQTRAGVTRAGQTPVSDAPTDAARETLAPAAACFERLGLVHLRARRWTEARDAARRALAIDPRRAEAWNGLGVALDALGAVTEAIDAWREAVAIDPERYDSLYNLGIRAQETGQDELARDAFERFLAGAPPERYADDLRRARVRLRRLDR